MNLESLKYFLRVAELGSLTKAAALLDTVQPVISRSITQLERDVGGRLFCRTGHGVQLSPLGESLLPRAKLIIHETESFIADGRSFVNTPTGEVRIGMPSLFPTILVPTLLKEVNEQLPGVKVKVFVGSIGRIDEWLEEGRIDISLNFGDGALLGDAQRIGNLDTYLVGKKGTFLDQRETIDFVELNGLPLILPATRNDLRKYFDDLAEELCITLNATVEVDTFILQLSLVLEGYGYTIMTVQALQQGGVSKDFSAAQIVKPRIVRTIMLGTSPRFVPSLAAQRVTSLIANIGRQIIAESKWINDTFP
jgi:LysR family nitrogen assimilation transcriptional regulator